MGGGCRYREHRGGFWTSAAVCPQYLIFIGLPSLRHQSCIPLFLDGNYEHAGSSPVACDTAKEDCINPWLQEHHTSLHGDGGGIVNLAVGRNSGARYD